mmetsp:Transcript_48368/g.138171  ORF Transcript_48368/g.138171 Transcript_48368/m.138171 type:complete len:370 (-) Transcript_48368:337-1446(-)
MGADVDVPLAHHVEVHHRRDSRPGAVLPGEALLLALGRGDDLAPRLFLEPAHDVVVALRKCHRPGFDLDSTDDGVPDGLLGPAHVPDPEAADRVQAVCGKKDHTRLLHLPDLCADVQHAAHRPGVEGHRPLGLVPHVQRDLGHVGVRPHDRFNRGRNAPVPGESSVKQGAQPDEGTSAEEPLCPGLGLGRQETVARGREERLRDHRPDVHHSGRPLVEAAAREGLGHSVAPEAQDPRAGVAVSVSFPSPELFISDPEGVRFQEVTTPRVFLLSDDHFPARDDRSRQRIEERAHAVPIALGAVVPGHDELHVADALHVFPELLDDHVPAMCGNVVIDGGERLPRPFVGVDGEHRGRLKRRVDKRRRLAPA